MSGYLNPLNLSYIEDLLKNYENDPKSLDPTWRSFFDGMNLGASSEGGDLLSQSKMDMGFELKVVEVIHAYRHVAYLIADVNPLDRTPKSHPLLELEYFGLQPSDLDRKAWAGHIIGLESATLKEIIARCRILYASPASIEIEHIEDPESRIWVQERVEKHELSKPLNLEQKKQALQKLASAEYFEKFLHKRFVGQKRFSLEGCDVVTPMIDHLITESAKFGADEIILGMAHRGRLNVLVNIFQKNLVQMFAEFSGNVETNDWADDGDVKYHLGFSLDTKTPNGHDMHLSLAPNPSHLEAINSVVMGNTHAKQRHKSDANKDKTWSVLLHGDAAFSGQGSVYEALNMSQLSGYNIGGTIHLILNNQVGFTANPHETRSTNNPTDIARMLQMPIFRVNADEIEAALRTIEIAVQFRNKFKRDVFIEVMGYRRYGHNEGDEPEFTQPLLYKKIKKHPTAFEIYSSDLVSKNQVSQGEVDQIVESLNSDFEKALDESKKKQVSPKMDSFGKSWTNFVDVPFDESIFEPAQTALPQKQLQALGEEILTMPSGFQAHRKIERVLNERREMVAGDRGFDWGMGEALAYGSLIQEGHSVRLAGQDAERGTFSHRHAVLHDPKSGNTHIPLDHIKKTDAHFEVINSLLSEYAALGFEFGESLAAPKQLTIWEAQFGDFVNGAQIIIDQFITSSAVKWQRFSGLVMLLPHGYEGQGPEHSSGRLERFLQACAQHNIQVCNLTTPAQFFHALRRQLKRDYRLPLVVMSPKSLLRNPQAISQWNDFTNTSFQEVIPETSSEITKEAERIIFCSGKIYYEILQERNEAKSDVPVIRLEQFYPFPKKFILDALAQYKNLKEIIWCQEEPENMGGWPFVQRSWHKHVKSDIELAYVGRAAQASPAMGYAHLHKNQQKHIVRKALTGEENDT